MKHEAKLLIGVGAFFSITDIVYWFWGYHYLSGNGASGPEQSGTMMLIGTVLLGLLPSGYYLLVVPSHEATPRGPPRCHHRRGFRGHRLVPQLECLAVRPRHGGIRDLPRCSVRHLALGASVLVGFQRRHRLHRREQARRPGLTSSLLWSLLWLG